MRKGLLILGLTAVLVFGIEKTVYAAGSVQFTEQNELKISSNLGEEFVGMAPGQTVDQTITISNQNGRTAEFYMNTKALQALEDSNTANGGAYNIQLQIEKNGSKISLYGSSLGGAATGTDDKIVGDEKGILNMNSSGIASDTTYLTTLGSGESVNLILTIGLDGESIRNADGNTYAKALGELGMSFLVAYRDPVTGQTVTINKVVKQASTPTANVVQTFKNVVVAVKTGDHTTIGALIMMIAVGIGLIVLTGKRKKTGETL